MNLGYIEIDEMDKPSQIQRIRRPGAFVDSMIAQSKAYDGLNVLILFDVRCSGGLLSPLSFSFHMH